MINLQDLFDNLAYGELSGVSMGNSNQLTIDESEYHKVVSFINFALLNLYKRFNLKQAELLLHQRAGVLIYYLRKDYAALIGDIDDTHYIEETAEFPFLGDVLKVLEVFDSLGNKVALDDQYEPLTGVFTISHDTIKMVTWDIPEVLTLKYQARYPKIEVTQTFSPADINLDVPDFLLEAICLYVASRLYSGQTSRITEHGQTPADTFLQKYELECVKLTQLDLFTDVNDTSQQFQNNGWV